MLRCAVAVALACAIVCPGLAWQVLAWPGLAWPVPGFALRLAFCARPWSALGSALRRALRCALLDCAVPCRAVPWSDILRDVITLSALDSTRHRLNISVGLIRCNLYTGSSQCVALTSTRAMTMTMSLQQLCFFPAQWIMWLVSAL